MMMIIIIMTRNIQYSFPSGHLSDSEEDPDIKWVPFPFTRAFIPRRKQIIKDNPE